MMALLVEVEVKSGRLQCCCTCVCDWRQACSTFRVENEIEVHLQLPHFKAHVVDQLAGVRHILLVKEI